jgi:hypothetical protein
MDDDSNDRIDDGGGGAAAGHPAGGWFNEGFWKGKPPPGLEGRGGGAAPACAPPTNGSAGPDDMPVGTMVSDTRSFS